MRTIKTALFTVLIALGGILSGQAYQAEYIQTGYRHESNRIEHYSNKLEHFFNKILNRSGSMERNGYREPVVSMSFVVEHANFLYENELAVESWMTHPFGNSIGETELTVESWMTHPFGNSIGETELTVESWMTEVF